MNFHDVKSIDVKRDIKRGWTTIKVTRHERVSMDRDSELEIANAFGIDRWDMADLVRRINKNGTITDEITLFHVDDKDIFINMGTVNE
mgnify:FL=1